MRHLCTWSSLIYLPENAHLTNHAYLVVTVVKAHVLAYDGLNQGLGTGFRRRPSLGALLTLMTYLTSIKRG